MAFFGKPEPPAAPPSPNPYSPNPERIPTPSPAPPGAGLSASSSASTVIGSRVKFVGDVSGDEDILINGRVEGKIRVDRKVVVSPGAEVEGDVQAKSVVIGGRVLGQVLASERAELLASGRVQGNVHAPRIVMAEGAQIQGRVVMPTDAAPRPLAASKAEEAPRRPMTPPKPEPIAPPKPEDTARPPASPGTGG